MREHFETAIANVTHLGDPDVLPLPIENQIFYDSRSETLDLLATIQSNFRGALASNPPVNEGLLAAVGYSGFRWITQIDPIWNLYFLALVVSLGSEIERARIPVDRSVVFSYRFKPDSASHALFDRNIGWVAFREHSSRIARQHKHVLSCDISDFYPRVYHHRLGNALNRAYPNSDAVWRLMELLKAFSKNVSYGLPVGGPAARLLSELLLNSVDRLLLAQNVVFCRFADDYRIFADSKEDLYQALLFLSEKLLDNEGLLLQKAKTRMVTSDEFIESEDAEIGVGEVSDRDARAFLRLRLRYDPYSQTADEDYEHLRHELSRFDVTQMLASEVRKSQVHQALARRLIGAVRFLDAAALSGAVTTLINNLHVLYPVFPSIAVLLRNVADRLEPSQLLEVVWKVGNLVRLRSYLVSIPVNLAYSIRVLSLGREAEVDDVLARVYTDSRSGLIRRDVILAMARRRADWWTSDKLKAFSTLTSWERRAILVASYSLGDEGDHWRKSVRSSLSQMENLMLAWAANKKAAAGLNWEVPL
jgi:hypothetical protein